MARDYRYGHRKKSVVTRRSQEGGVVLAQQTPSVTAHVAPLTAKAKIKSESAELSNTIGSIEPPTTAPNPTPELVSAPESIKSSKKKAKKKAKSVKAEPNVESTSKKEADGHNTNTVEPSSDSGLSIDEPDDDEPVSKKKFFWLKLTGLVVLLTSVTGWLVYAPFILAFLLEIGVIDEDTRLRWDSREARQPQIAFVEKVLPVVPEAKEDDKKVIVESSTDTAPSVKFTFYDELPKAAIELAAQPLPVRTKAPTYLRLAAFMQTKDANEERGRLAQKGFLAKITTRVAQNGKMAYVLLMGPYDDQEKSQK